MAQATARKPTSKEASANAQGCRAARADAAAIASAAVGGRLLHHHRGLAVAWGVPWGIPWGIPWGVAGVLWVGCEERGGE